MNFKNIVDIEHSNNCKCHKITKCQHTDCKELYQNATYKVQNITTEFKDAYRGNYKNATTITYRVQNAAPKFKNAYGDNYKMQQ